MTLKNIEESLSVLDYLEERKKAHEDMKAHGIPDYEKVKKERDDLARQVEELKELLEAKAPEAEIHEEAPKPAKKSYDDLVQEIIDNHLDLHHIYDCLDAITTDHPDILRGKYSELFNRLYESKPHTIIPLFAHHGTRPYYTIDNSKLKDATLGVNYVDGDKTIKIFDTQFGSGSFQNYNNPTWWPPELLEKVNFLSVLNRFMYSIFEESDEVITGRYQYIKIVRRKAGANWFAVEPPSNNFMILSRFNNRDYQAFFSCTGTYAHHSADQDELKTKGKYIPVLLPVFEGIDVKGTHFGMRMAYVEAR